MEREVRVERSPAHCPYCKDALQDLAKIVACAACGARHHDACHAEHGRCASCGASATLTAHPRAASHALEPPRGSSVTIVRETGVSTITFPHPPRTETHLWPKGSHQRKLANSAALCGLLPLAAALLVAIVGLAAGAPGALAAGAGLLALALGLFAVAGLTILEFRSIPRPPGAIVLGDEITFPAAYGQVRKAPRADVGHVRSERFSHGEGMHQYRLTIDVGVERIPVALSPRLKEPEIDWIADVIRAWKAEA